MTWRVGRGSGRTLYRDEVSVGRCDDPKVAAEVVEVMNSVAELREEVDRLEHKEGGGVAKMKAFYAFLDEHGNQATLENGRTYTVVKCEVIRPPRRVGTPFEGLGVPELHVVLQKVVTP